jgi:hypothetical protein
MNQQDNRIVEDFLIENYKHLDTMKSQIKARFEELEGHEPSPAALQRHCHIWSRLQRQGAFESSTNRNRCSHISGLCVKVSSHLRALMKCALLLLINLAAFTALDNVRVWRSRSDRSCHQFKDTLGMVEECLGSLPMLCTLYYGPDAILLVMC